MKLNENQQIVLDTFINKRLCFVNASAGTGKTTTLIKSYIALLERNEKVEDIVVITFTKAAANEMLIRIRSEIRQRIKAEDSPKQKAYWNSVYSSVLSNSNITTIHAFAQKIVSENSLYLGLPSSINILEEDNDFIDNLHHIIDKLLEKSESGKVIYSLYNLYIIDKRNSFIENILSFINNIKPRLESIEAFEDKVSELIGGKYSYDNLMNLINSRDIDFCITYDNSTSNAKIEEVKPLLASFKKVFNKIYGKNNIDIEEFKELYSESSKINNFGIGNIKKDFKEEYAAIKELTSKLSITLEPLCYKKEIDCFLSFIKEAYTKIEEAKKRSGVYSHDDIISIAINALENKELKDKIRNNVSSLILDEAQDTSSLQFNFINLIIFGKRNVSEEDIKNIGNKRLFIVGDRKQSIYRFRNANVEEFLNIEEKLNSYGAVLRDNYRSNNHLIQFFNNIFQNYVFNEDQIKYNENDNLVGHKESSEKPVKILALNNNTENSEKIKAEEARNLEANAIALFAKDNLKNEYKDTTLLLRGFSKINVYLDALSKHSIPFYVEGGRGFYQREEITEIMSFLYYLFLFETQSLDLLLTYPFFDISIDEIFSLKNKLSEHKLKVNDYISIYRENTIEGYKAKTIASSTHFFDKLEKIKKIINLFENTAYVSNVYNIIESICKETNYYSYLASKVDAEICISNVEKLKDIAKEYEHGTGKTAYDFVVSVKKANDVNTSLCQVPKLDIESLRIMTIHKSKGLEFKNIFFASLGSRVNNSKASFYFVDNKPVINLPVSRTEKIVFPFHDKNDAKIKEESEKKRLLYVALTRAANKLILSGEGATKTTYRYILDKFFSLTADNMLSTKENKSENMTDISLDNSFENGIADLYVYGRGIKLAKPSKENRDTLSLEYDINNQEKDIINTQYKKIYINTASGSANKTFKPHTYNLESLIDNKVAYFEDDDSTTDNYKDDDIKPSPADLGTALHSILENFNFDDYKKSGNVYIKNITEETLVSFSGYNKEYVREIVLSSIDKYLKDIHIKNILDGNEEIVMREASFQKSYKDESLNINIMKGKIDLITKDKNNNYYVIDYKVASKNNTNEESYQKQIAIYKTLVSESLDIDLSKISTYLMYLK